MKYRRKLRTTENEYKGRLIYRTTSHRPTADGFRAFAKRQNSALEDWLAEVRQWAGATLRDTDLPDDLRFVLCREDGTWTELPEDWRDWSEERKLEYLLREGGNTGTAVDLTHAPPPGNPFLPAEFIEVDAGSAFLSPAWHAARALLRAEEMEAAIARGNAKEAARCGALLSEEFWRGNFAQHFELNALVGMARRKGRPPANRTPEGISQAWKARAAVLRARHPEWSTSKVARDIAAKLGGSVSTIKKNI